MSARTETTHISINHCSAPKIAVGILLGVSLVGIFMVGYDQGHLFSLAQGKQAFDNLWVHELFHDMRHAAGFPCH